MSSFVSVTRHLFSHCPLERINKYLRSPVKNVEWFLSHLSDGVKRWRIHQFHLPGGYHGRQFGALGEENTDRACWLFSKVGLHPVQFQHLPGPALRVEGKVGGSEKTNVCFVVTQLKGMFLVGSLTCTNCIWQSKVKKHSIFYISCNMMLTVRCIIITLKTQLLNGWQLNEPI